MVVKGTMGAWSRGWDPSHQIWIHLTQKSSALGVFLILVNISASFFLMFKLVHVPFEIE
ncbi:hypothetical protein SLEP1_g57608 [Rubroshorea leprosula]|uniref:Uncharacterized protein n=1 Tax=Rubroshorea leprosula TaxID=152421 RepID=A0AAV5MM67_9ROSI|nr:hypothetical protein SLEP1_g57608 [Rubroshorea leprosula]